MLAKLAISSFAFVGAQLTIASAMAQTAPDGEFNGVVEIAISGSGIHYCDLAIELDALADTGTIAIMPGDPMCSGFAFNNAPYTTSYSSGVLEIYGVYFSSIIPNDCAGDMHMTWDGTWLTLSTSLPPATIGFPCRFTGFAA